MMPVRFSTSRNSKPPASLVMDPPSNCPRTSRCFRGLNGNGSWLHSVVIRLSPFVGVTATLNIFYATKRQPLLFFNEKCGLDPSTTRSALIDLVRQAKRGKAFQDCRFLGLAVDGTGAGRSHESHCDWCRPIHDGKLKVLGYHHQVVAISVVGTGLTLPFDVEPYGPGDSEYAAAQRLLRRAIGALGIRFADYVVADGEFASAPFLHTVNRLGLHAVVRLKENLPLLSGAVQRRFQPLPPTHV